MSQNENDEESDIFAFAYKKSSSLKKRSSDSNLQSEKNNEDFLLKNREMIYSKSNSRKKLVRTEESKAKKEKSLEKAEKTPKKANPQKAKKAPKKEKSLNMTYKSAVSQEECDYLFKILNDGASNLITETAIRKALNAAGMTDVDDNAVLVFFPSLSFYTSLIHSS